jgi:hypothetical protein
MRSFDARWLATKICNQGNKGLRLIVGVAAHAAMLQGPGVSGAGPELGAGVLLDLGQSPDVILVGVVADQLPHGMQRDAHGFDVALDQRGDPTRR